MTTQPELFPATTADEIATKLWAAADTLRGHMDASEYKHIVLGLIFLKYISDSFEAVHDILAEGATAENGVNPEDPDEYLARNIFWVPPEARWSELKNNARSPQIGKIIDDAMLAIEKANDSLKGVLPRDYSRPSLDKIRLGQLIDNFTNILFTNEGGGDLLGEVYQYFLGRFASAEGKGGGEFYTPASIVQLLVEMLEPLHGRVYDPCCGSGGMFVYSEKFVEAHNGKRFDISIYGQESNNTTWKLAKMNLAIRGIEADLGPHQADSFINDLHSRLFADFILANPPFNISDWGGVHLRTDKRWQYGLPPLTNANYGWLQHIIFHLGSHGSAGVVLANGSMSSGTGGEGEIRRAIVKDDIVDCMVALPPQLFYSTQIPACLWFLTKSKTGPNLRDRRGQVLFIDARSMGRMLSRVQRELTAADLALIAGTYHNWKRYPIPGEYTDLPGFCKSATLEEIAANDYILTPGRYVGAPEAEADLEPFEAKMQRLTATLRDQFTESARLETLIQQNLKELGYDK